MQGMIFGYLDIWIFGYLDIWIFGYLDIWIDFPDAGKLWGWVWGNAGIRGRVRPK